MFVSDPLPVMLALFITFHADDHTVDTVMLIVPTDHAHKDAISSDTTHEV